MEKIKELYFKYKDEVDCSYQEFISLYDTLLEELSAIGSDKVKYLLDMDNHEYSIVKNWPLSSGSTVVYEKNRRKAFEKMKDILKDLCNN